jgi:hypothetical protein
MLGLYPICWYPLSLQSLRNLKIIWQEQYSIFKPRTGDKNRLLPVCTVKFAQERKSQRKSSGSMGALEVRFQTLSLAHMITGSRGL